MRVLLTAVPAVAHVLALVPLARALRRRGHEVALLSAESARPLIPPDVDFLETGPDLAEARAPEADHPEEFRPDGLPMRVGIFFGAVRTIPTLPGARRLADAWRPDLVVSEGLDGVGGVLAAERSLPHAGVSLGPVCMADIDDRIHGSLAEHGIATARPTRRFDPWPAVLRPPGWQAPGPLTPVRAELALPDEAAGPADVPTGGGSAVLVTFGTLWADPATLSPVVDALTAAGHRVVVALPPGLDRLAVAEPDRVRVRPFGPLGAVLDAVDVVVCHAGAATVLAAAVHARPVVAVPLAADHHLNAAGVEAAGTGVRVPLDAGAAAIAAATTAVVGNDAIRARVEALAGAIAATGSWDEVAVPVLEDLAR